MADDLVGTLKGFGQSIYTGAKALTGTADWVGTKLGIGGVPSPAPMPGRLSGPGTGKPLGAPPDKMPVYKAPTGELKKKAF